MTKRKFFAAAVIGAIVISCFGRSDVLAQNRRSSGGAGPPDPPKWYDQSEAAVGVASVVPGEKAGLDVSQYAPNFQLQPVKPYESLRKWLGASALKDSALREIDREANLMEFVGKAPIMLYFGSYT